MIPRATPGLPVLMVLGNELRKARAAQNGHRLGEAHGIGPAATERGSPQVAVVGRDPAGYVWTPPRPPRGAIDRPFFEAVTRPRGTSPGRQAA